MKYGKRSASGRFISSPFTVVGLFIFVILLGRAAWGIHGKAQISAEKLLQAKTELAKLQIKQDELSKDVEYLSTDKGVEAEFRTKYHAVKEGESVAVIVDRDQKTASITLSESEQNQLAAVFEASSTPRLSWWRRLLQGLGL